MKLVIWILVGALVILHQDFWLWHDSEIYFGFIPSGLLYHIGVSIVASIVWLLACTTAWPKGIDDFESDDDTANAQAKDGGAA